MRTQEFGSQPSGSKGLYFENAFKLDYNNPYSVFVLIMELPQ
jgi:hypothetical protein